jgi:hypothetical protein
MTKTPVEILTRVETQRLPLVEEHFALRTAYSAIEEMPDDGERRVLHRRYLAALSRHTARRREGAPARR